MSTRVGSIHYDLNLNTKQFDDAVSNVSSKLKSTGQSLSSFGQSLTTKVTLPLAAFTTGMVASAAQLEKTAASFNVLVGEGEKARKLFAQIKAFADKTPFEFPELAKATTTLLGYGVAAEDVLDRLKRLGDAAAASGGDLNGVTLAYAQMIGRGKVTGDNLRQLTENMVTLRAELSKVSGIPMNQLDKAIEGGLITTEMLNKALDMATNQGGKFFGGTEKLAQTFSGRLSTVKDQLLEVGRNLLGVKVDDKLGLTVQEGGVFDLLSKMLPKVAENARKLADAFERLTASQKKFVIGGTGALAVLGPLLMALGGIIKAGAAVAAVLGSVVFIKVVAVLALVAGAVFLVKKNWETLVNFYKSYVIPMWEGIVDIMRPAIEITKYIISLYQQYLAPAFISMANFIVSQFKPALDNFKQAWDNLRLAIEPYMPQLRLLGQILGAVLIVVIGSVVAAIAGLVLGLGYLIGAFMKVQNFINDLVLRFQNFQITVRNSVINAMQSVVNTIGSYISSMFYSGVKLLDGFINGIKSGFDKAVTNVRDGLNRIRRMLPFSPAKEGPFSGQGWTLYSGKSLMEGLAQGIKSNSNLPQLALNDALAGASLAINGSNAQPTGPTNNTSISINGDIKLGDQSAVQEFFGRLNRNNELAQKGMAVI